MTPANLATKEENQQLATLPEHLRGEVGLKEGHERGRENILVPQLRIAQALSPQLKKSNEAFIPELEAGQFFNSVTGKVYGEEVTVIPLSFFRQFIQFKDIKEGGGIVRMYQPGEVPPVADLAFVDGKPPLCTEFKSRFSLILRKDETFEPVVVSFKSTGMKAARRWNYLIAEKNLPAYAFVYNFTVKTLSGKGNEWFGFGIERGDYTPAAIYEQAKDYFASLQEAGVQVDTSGLEPEGTTIEDGGPAPF
jgi:hypothetical protein